jgi:hypothetical protein
MVIGPTEGEALPDDRYLRRRHRDPLRDSDPFPGMDVFPDVV